MRLRIRLLSFDDAQPFFGAGTVIGGANPQGTGDGTKTEQMAGMFSAGGGSPLIAEGPNGTPVRSAPAPTGTGRCRAAAATTPSART